MSDRKKRRGKTGDVLALLDIGTSKIACAVAERGADEADGAVLGFAWRRSRGVAGGAVVDLDEAETVIRATVSAAEENAGVRVREALVSTACGRMASRRFTAKTGVVSGVVQADDVAQAMAAGRAFAERDGRAAIHLSVAGARLDGTPIAGDPVGLAAATFSASLHAVTVEAAALRNVAAAVARCHLDVAGFVAAPYASALGCTTAEERRRGVTCLDLGAGTASAAVFRDGRFVFSAVEPSGGNHIVQDIARALQTSLAEARRIKAVYGTLIETQTEEYEMFSYPCESGESGVFLQATKASLARIIRPRLSGALTRLVETLAGPDSPFRPGERIVVTGGLAQLPGIDGFVRRHLERPVRLAWPRASAPLPEPMTSPAFAAVTGLLAWTGAAGGFGFGARPAEAPAGYLGRVRRWLGSGF